MRRTFLKGLAATAVLASGLAGASVATAQDAAEFFAGKTIKWIVPYRPGGGYDEYSRLIVPYMEKYTGSQIEIANIPGSGGMRGAVEIFKAPADGLHIGIINGSAMITNELAEIEGADYKVADYNFLGRMVADVRVMVASSLSEINSFDDLMGNGRPEIIGATGLGGSTYVDAVIVASVFGMDQRVVHGFNSSSDIRTSMLRGEVQGMWGSLGSAISGVEDGDHKIILHGEREATGVLEGIPSVFDIAANSADPEKANRVLEGWEGLSAVGRPVAAPPGVPEDRLAFLREAFAKAMTDPEFVALAESSGRDLAFRDGEATARLAKSATDLDEETRALFVAAIKGEL